MRMYGNDYVMREDYGRGRSRDSQGRYMGNTGRRYRGEDTIDEMRDHYMTYSANKDMRGNYGAESATIKSLEYMLESVCDFLKMLEREATSPEEIELIKEYARKIGNM